MRKTLQRLSLAVLIASTPAAWAGNVAASAGQNLVGTVVDRGDGPTAFAQFGNGPSASASYTHVGIDILGAGVPHTQHHFANAIGSMGYDLWHLQENRALSAAEAQGLVLDFNFHFSGVLDVDAGPVLSVAGQDYSLAVASSRLEQIQGRTTLTGGDGGIGGGGSGPSGVFDLMLSLQHVSSPRGLVSLSLAGLASNAGQSTALIELESISFGELGAAFAAPASARGFSALALAPAAQDPLPWIGVRVRESGQIFEVQAAGGGGGGGGAAVPEPAPALLLAAALAAWALGRRRGRYSRPW